MKFCIQGLPRSILLLAFATIAACGGGTEPIASPPTPFIMASVPAPAKKASTVTGGNGVVIHMYQALYGMAPSNTLLADYAFQANNDASTFAKNLTDRFASTSHADLTKLVLDNLGVTPTSVPAVNAKGESEYGLLLDAVKQIFTAFPTMRGQVILNMVNLLAGLETDVTYRAAAVAFNNQTFANYNSSMNDGVELFASTPILLSDLRTKYELLCGSQVMVQNAIPIDLNRDGKVDLIFNLWCKNTPDANPLSGAAPNTLVALIQLSDGSFVDKTRELFGSDIVDVGGVGVNFVVTDLNNDGYDDVVITCSLEDGRNSHPRACPMISFVSDGKGQYNKIPFGMLEGDEVRIIKDQNGNKQLIFLPASGNTEVWAYGNGWAKVPGFEWLHKNAVFTDISNIPTVINKSNNGALLEIWQQFAGAWTKQVDYAYVTPIVAQITNSSMQTSTTTILRVDGIDYIDYGGLYESCALKRTKNGPTEILFTFLGVPIIGGYSGQILVDHWEPPTLKLISFEINGSGKTITISPTTLNTDRLDSNFYHMACGDINNDGLEDILERTTGTPVIYINNGQGKYGKLNSNLIPKPFNGSSHIYVDIDGDGVKDLLYFPIDRWQLNPTWPSTTIDPSSKVQFLLYKGIRYIRQNDLIFSN